MTLDDAYSLVGAFLAIWIVSWIPAKLWAMVTGRRRYRLAWLVCFLLLFALTMVGYQARRARGAAGLAPAAAGEEAWVRFEAPALGTMTGPRFLDVASLEGTGTIIRYRRKYVTSGGRLSFVSVSEIDCATGAGRALAIRFFDDTGQPLGPETRYPDPPFQATPNDPVHRMLVEILCVGGQPADRGTVERRLRVGAGQ